MNPANESAIPVQPAAVRPRLDSVDLVRGWIMLIMALDHVRDFFNREAFLFEPTDLSKTSAALFLTRWITHFCAPVFFFLAGTGAFLSLTRGKTKDQLAYFLVTRGLWLVVLEVTVVHWFGWGFGFDFSGIGGLVLWALGWSMVALAALIYLPIWAVATFGILMIAGHNLFDGVSPDALGSWRWLWIVLHNMGGFRPFPNFSVFIVYPLIPWVGVMAAGYAFGTLLKLERPLRRRRLILIGLGLSAAFVIIRAINLYGDPRPWSPQTSALFTVFSFLNCEKYPPSLLYLLMTLGPAILLIGLLDRDLGKLSRPILVFGRVPLFFYLLHLPLIHALAILLAYFAHGRVDFLLGPPFRHFETGGALGYGYSLPIVYLIWLIVVALLYLPCAWFAKLKQRRREAWLSYF